MAILERIVSAGFSIVAFPLYANAVGVRRGGFAALLDPIPGDGFRLFGEPCVLLDGNLTVRVTEKGKSWFCVEKIAGWKLLPSEFANWRSLFRS